MFTKHVAQKHALLWFTFMKELRVSVAVCRPAAFRESAAGAKRIAVLTDHVL